MQNFSPICEVLIATQETTLLKGPYYRANFLVSKLLLVECLNFSQRVTKTCQVKTVENCTGLEKKPNTAYFQVFLNIQIKYGVIGIFLMLGAFFSVFSLHMF